MWNLRQYGNKVALYSKEYGEISYEEMAGISEEISGNITGRELVCVITENSVECLCGYIGFINNRIVPLMIDGKTNAEWIHNLIDQYKPNYIWCNKEMEEAFKAYSKIYTMENYVLLKRKVLVEIDLYKDLALLLTTSGSTGSSKFVRQSYKNIKANAESIIEYLKITASEVSITTIPMHYTYGLSIIHTHLMVGAKLVLTQESLVSPEFWKLYKECNVTSFGGVPYTYEILKKIKFFQEDNSSLNTITQAGGHLNIELQREIAEAAQKQGYKFVVMYGQTEATARMSYLPSEKCLIKLGSIGIPIPGGKFELVDADGSVIEETDKEGELVYYGDNVTLGYAACREDLALGDERKGRLLTGDMAKRDADGFYYITGRKERFLKIYSNRVNLDECERILERKFGFGVACTGEDDALHVFIDNSDEQEKVKLFIKEKFNINTKSIFIHYIKEIPKNTSGKKLYKELIWK